MRLSELLDVPVLQKLTEANHRATGMPIGIIDALDGSLVAGLGWQDICVRLHCTDPRALQRCRGGALDERVASTAPREQTCKNGLHGIGIPILAGGEHLATLFLGPFFHAGETPDRAHFAAQARELGIDEASCLAALDRVPTFSEDTVGDILRYSEALARFIADLAERTVMQVKHEDALRDREEWFRAIVETIPQMVFVGERGGNVYNNARLEQYTGLTTEALRGYGWTQTLHPDDVERAAETWSRSQVTGEPFTSIDRVRRHDGEYRWFLTAAAPLRDRAGNIVRWIGTWTDVHDRVVAEEALQDVGRRKDEFLAVLSHELRNPLAPIQNAHNILERAAPDSEQAARARAVIGRQVEHLTRLVDDLLDVTRISRGKVQLRCSRVDLGAVVRKTVEDLHSILGGRRVALELPDPGAPVWVNGDPTRLAQVVGNLLVNAAKFTEAGGHVSIAVERSGGDAIVRIRDDGVGIAPDVLRMLFHPFAQADRTLHRTQGGLGLGLALVKGIVGLHGGDVKARSEGEGTGAEFVVSLPAAPEERQTDRDEPRTRDVERCTILVVEDNEDAAATLRDLLELDGHVVHVARDGDEGLTAAHRLRPDVILCDIGLPGLDGYEVARRLRRDPEADATTLVALTGYATEEDSQRAHRAGFDHHLGKPPDMERLQQILADAGRRRARSAASELRT